MKYVKTMILALLAALLEPLRAYFESVFVLSLTGRDVHIDGPLSNIAVEAFQQGDFVAERLFPTVSVGKQSDGYFVIDKAAWLRLPRTTLRAPKTAPARVEFTVSTDTYFCHNYALAGENPFEVLANADNPIQLRQRTTRFVMDMLMRDRERRLALKVTSISNLGSGVALTGGNKWSAYSTSDPIADITTGHAFIRGQTGLIANTLLLDWDTNQIVRRHPMLLDMYKYTQGGLLNDAELREVFKVSQIIVANGIFNNFIENAAGTMSITNIWGNVALLAHIAPPNGQQTQTFGLNFQWQAPELPAAFGVSVYNDPDPGKKTELTEVGYYADEKIVAQQLSYIVKDTL